MAREGLSPDEFVQEANGQWLLDIDTARKAWVSESDGCSVVPVDRLWCWIDLNGTSRTEPSTTTVGVL